jgi:hypothetical protein
VPKYDVEQLKLDLACSVRSFCVYLFPNGTYKIGEYAIGSLSGEPGNSLKICAHGTKVGVWRDFATGEGENNLLDLLHKTRGGSFREACEEAAEWLSNPERYKMSQRSLVRREYGYMARFQKNKLLGHEFKDLTVGTPQDHAILANVLGINPDGLLLAERDGVLKFFDHPMNGRCWSVVDKHGYVRQDRRLDGKPFVLKDKKSAKARTIGSPTWPIGVPTDKQVILLSEGSSDFLAAYSLIYTEDLENKVTPVTMLGAANRIQGNALQYFRDKYVFGFPDYDAAGIEGMARWHDQLNGIAAGFEVFDYTCLLRDDGQKVKDLRNFLRVDVDQWESCQSVRYPLAQFIFKILKQ